ncbi:MAG: sigma-54 dependent transcriptional regulator [Maribacter sp.]|uniref:sigma-54-dependent transcriptional regulator n=1 Tax=Maribacter sp. TaxID=1897614 RepID=UPI003C791806
MALHKENILIVDDDIDILELLQRHLKSMDYHAFKAVSVKEALFILKDTFIDLLITDIQMPEVDGLQLLKYADEHYPEMPKLVITGYPSVDGALEVIKSGATDYLTKPFTKDELKQAVQKSIESGAKLEKRQPSIDKGKNNGYADMIGDSEAFQKITDIIDRVKNNRATVLIQGESGTGKELVARAIHYSGKFSRAPFIAVNCGAIPENLQEAELFGYTKGAFTGANENRNGFFQAAEGGTLFLDEIGSASLAVQTKLLRALQEKEITRVGSRKIEKVDIRIIAATNSDLLDDIKNKDFREDLYYRLTVVEINVPPLRERKSDVSLLVEKFLRKYGVEYKDRLLRISPEALLVLERYHWPGNIRELENIIQRVVIMSDGVIGVKDLPDFLKFQIDFPDTGFLPLREMEKEYVQKVLLHAQGNKTKAAEILQIDRKTLRDKLKS